jgi:hypothetical protein
MKARLFVAVSLAVLLAGCGGHKEKDQRTASGQVLQGTISDDMLPLATLTSQPPHMRVKGSASGTASADDQDVLDQEATDEAADTPPNPAASGEGD